MAAREPFELEGVVHLVRPWGSPAGDLERLRAGIAEAPEAVLFHHAVQHQLRHAGAEELPPDDFSAWIAGVVQDGECAERLAFAVQGASDSAEHLRKALLSVLEAIPERQRLKLDAPEGTPFLFCSATSVRFRMDSPVRDPGELVAALLAADASVWFLHLVEEPFQQGGRGPLLDWLERASDDRLARWLEDSARGGLPLDKARARLARRWRQRGIGQRVAEAARIPEAARREAGRQAVARLVRRHPANGGEK